MNRDERAKMLDELHDAMLTDLLAKIKAGEATAADRKLAWDLLKDNGVFIEDLKALGANATPLAEELPFDDDQETIIGRVG